MDNHKLRREQRGDTLSMNYRRPPKNKHPDQVKTDRHSGEIYWLVRSIGKLAAHKRLARWHRFLHSSFLAWPKQHIFNRVFMVLTAFLFLTSTIAATIQPFLEDKKYELTPTARLLLPQKSPQLAQLMKFDSKEQKYLYNTSYTGVANPESDMSSTGSARIHASFSKQPHEGVSVTDPVNNVSFTLKPKFSLKKAQQDDNQILYRLGKQTGYVVYTARLASVKEDIILDAYSKDRLDLDYELGLQDGLEARLENDGSIGVYGSSLPITGNVSTGSEHDAELLQKARDKARKDKLLFSIPAPVVIGPHKKASTATSRFEIDGSNLKIISEGLKDAEYPLSIDPTVYVDTAARLMRGNNETNTDFDVDNELIQKSQTTGARIDAWSNTSNLSTPVWGHGTAIAGGFVYTVGGAGASSITTNSYDTAGAHSYNVPAGVTSITVKVWGAGGGGGAGSGSSGSGADGGGGGYAKSVITVTPLESLNIDVGTGGVKGSTNTFGGDGGGYSAVRRSSTFLIQAGGGGGGGGARGNQSGGAGGAGGGSSGIAGSAGGGGSTAGGGGGTTTAGGAGGAVGTAGGAGVANSGGDGAATSACGTSRTTNGNAGGTGGGGDGGNFNGSCANAGGGGGGRFGGGGGSATGTNNRGGGGGGGGSSLVTGTSTVETAGSGATPGNNGDSDRGSAGQGGTGATTAASASNGNPGKVVISYTTVGVAASTSVSWAKVDPVTSAIQSPNPGAGVCSGWCSDSVYNLPQARRGLGLIAYNGFLYAIGGVDATGTHQSTVYVAKIGVNGEPQLWHPSGGTPVYWYSDASMNLTAARSHFGSVAYNNKLYILGGVTTSNAVISSNTVQFADINPMGTLTSWSTTGMQALTSNRYGLTAQVYNDTLYVIGGNATYTGTPITTVEYSRLNSDGTMNSWVTTSSLQLFGGAGRQTMGGSFSTIWGAYVYVGGGCTAVNALGYCTSIASDVQLASINADGSLSEWNTIIGLDNSRIAHSMIAWQGALYRLGGCRAQDSTTGGCTDTAIDVDYGVINQDGEASTVATSVGSGTAPCSGGSPTSCNLPSSAVGNVLNQTAIMNGFLYIMGGCTNNACTSVSSGVTYQAIASDGSLRRPATCAGTYVDSYCSSTITLPAASAAGATTVFNNRIYIIGGFTSNTSIYYTSVNVDGSINSWSSATLTTIGAQNLSYAFAYARANPSSAGSVPGNLFIFGGCQQNTVGCSSYSDAVYKCNLSTAGVPSSCTTTGQLQIGTVTGASGSGLGAMAGTVYANYIYLMGGLAPGITDLKVTRYAKFDNSNNVVAVSGSAWIEGSNELGTGRRRGAGFGYNGYLYVVGGYDGTTGVLADIEFAKINVSDGSWGVWSDSSVTINQRWGLTVPISNSYAYVIGGCTAGAAPSSCTTRTDTIQTFQIYNNNSGTPNDFSVQSDQTFAASTDRWGAGSAILNGYLYVAGGCVSATDCTDAIQNVQYAPISATDGSVGTWVSASNGLPTERAWGQLVVAGGNLYWLGGQDDVATNEQVQVYYASSFSSGNITAAWSQASGGIGDTASQAAQCRTKFAATVWNNRIYVIGGLNCAANPVNTVFVSPQLNSGGNIAADSWTQTTAFNIARSGAAVTSYANNLYIFGGYDGSNYLNDSQVAQINSDGSVTSWNYTTSLPVNLREAQAFGANGYIYLVGGRSATSTCAPKMLVTPISANTTIVSGNLPTGIGEWYETNVKYDGGRYGASVAYGAGKVYVMGGGCSSPQSGTYTTGTITQSGNTITGSGTSWSDNMLGGTITYFDSSTAVVTAVNSATSISVNVSKTISTGQTYSIANTRHFYGTLKSQPQIAKYSRMIDTDTDVFPTGFLMNGIDNSIGARWQLRYRSMHDLDAQVNPNEDCGTSLTMPQMTTWGQETNFGNVTLGQVETYTPKNSSGGNINCARYFYFSISIDASQTFGYPEDVQRGPTIADLSLFYTSDPSKRLRHGKTFTGGEQQPLDTPCRQSGGQANCPLP